MKTLEPPYDSYGWQRVASSHEVGNSRFHPTARQVSAIGMWGVLTASLFSDHSACGMAGDTQLRFTRGHMVRQVHGRDARPGAWPWHAAIYVDGTFQCSGVILNENWTLTTAHCVYYDAKIKKRNILVRVGE